MNDEERIKIIAYQACFGTPHGNRVLEDLEKYCYEHRSTFVENSQDKQNVNNGKRSVILHIRELMNIDLHKPEEKKTVKQDDGKII